MYTRHRWLFIDLLPSLRLRRIHPQDATGGSAAEVTSFGAGGDAELTSEEPLPFTGEGGGGGSSAVKLGGGGRAVM